MTVAVRAGRGRGTVGRRRRRRRLAVDARRRCVVVVVPIVDRRHCVVVGRVIVVGGVGQARNHEHPGRDSNGRDHSARHGGDVAQPRRRAAATSATAANRAAMVSAGCGRSETSRPSIHEIPVTRVAIQPTSATALTAPSKTGGDPSGTYEPDDGGTHLGDRQDHEHSRQLRVLGMDAGCRGVQHAAARRRDGGDRQSVVGGDARPVHHLRLRAGHRHRASSTGWRSSWRQTRKSGSHSLRSL